MAELRPFRDAAAGHLDGGGGGLSRPQRRARRSMLRLLPALNDMIDITTTRLMATRMHPPGMHLRDARRPHSGRRVAWPGTPMASHPRWSWMHALALATGDVGDGHIIIDTWSTRDSASSAWTRRTKCSWTCARAWTKAYDRPRPAAAGLAAGFARLLRRFEHDVGAVPEPVPGHEQPRRLHVQRRAAALDLQGLLQARGQAHGLDQLLRDLDVEAAADEVPEGSP